MEAVSASDRGNGAPARGGAAGVVVLGAGRSGTSAVTRAFLAAGFFAGREDELLGPVPSNPIGHYEPIPVLEANEELLRRFGCLWGGDAPAPDEQIALRAEVTPRLRSILATLIERGGGAPVAVKEPRINLLVPFWEPVIDGVLHPVLAVRDPLEVALSMASRDGTSVGQALASWEAQMALALGWLDGRTVTVVHYARLTERPELAGEVVREASAHLDPERAQRIDPGRAASALRPDLRHQDAVGLDHDDHMTLRQTRLWECVAALPEGDCRPRVPTSVRRPSAAALAATRKESERVKLVRDHEALAAGYAAEKARAEELERSLEAHSRELQEVRGSTSWRLTAPLRRLARLLSRG